MKKLIAGVVGFPNDCETVQFTACFVSMYMRAEGIYGIDKHKELYNLYNAITGYSFLQIDLSNVEHMSCSWDFTCQKVLREFDYYVGFTMDYAGYEFEETQAPESEDSLFYKIKASIDQDIPVIIQFKKDYQWVTITGYDDNKTLYGLDGSQGYWGKSPAKPTAYEDGLFIMPDWYNKMAHAFILGKKKETKLTIEDVFIRGIQIMEFIQKRGYYKNSVSFMRNDDNFLKLDENQLLQMRDRISMWIGQPIDQRAVLGWSMKNLSNSSATNDKIITYNRVNDLCKTSHDVLWIAWKALGEYMDGEPIDWAKNLQFNVVRNMIADCFDIVCRGDESILHHLKESFVQVEI
ncbi:MAG: hypothetical protein K0S61_901 [Anaerocolumna sp.]|jgi:hypothetical protein|nr:hypothetical protein [Anaerocolumna sp.]